MKAAEEWMKQSDDEGGFDSNDQCIDRLQEIQLDAFKAGMEFAAMVAQIQDPAYDVDGLNSAMQRRIYKAILTTAQQLKEIPR